MPGGESDHRGSTVSQKARCRRRPRSRLRRANDRANLGTGPAWASHGKSHESSVEIRCACAGRAYEPDKGQRSLDPEIMAPFATHVVVGHGIFAFGAAEYLFAGFDRLLCTGDRLGSEAGLE